MTVLTITRNRADLIHRCIVSIQKQTYKNYEHIIVDGCSEDNTEDVVKSYNDYHIRYIKLNHFGPEVQMKAGFEASKGAYVTFLDDDDEYLPDKIEKQVSLLDSLPYCYGMVYCWMTYYNSKNQVIKVHCPSYRGWVKDNAVAENRISGTPTIMVRRDILSRIGGIYHDSHCGLPGSDVYLATRICSVTNVDYIPESLVKVYTGHDHRRLSERNDTEFLMRSIRFHSCFLEDYPEVFNANPLRANYHLFYITRLSFKLGNYKKGFSSLKQLLDTNPSLRQVLSVISALLLKK